MNKEIKKQFDKIFIAFESYEAEELSNKIKVNIYERTPSGPKRWLTSYGVDKNPDAIAEDIKILLNDVLNTNEENTD